MLWLKLFSFSLSHPLINYKLFLVHIIIIYVAHCYELILQTLKLMSKILTLKSYRTYYGTPVYVSPGNLASAYNDSSRRD